MGCSGSSMDIYEPNRFRDKTLIWLLGGGPGSPKPQYLSQFTKSGSILDRQVQVQADLRIRLGQI